MPSAVEKELLDLERKYWQAMQDKDAETALRLTDDPCIVSGAQGVASLDRQRLVGMLKQGGWEIRRFEIDPDVKLRMLGDDVAVLAYKVREELTVDGKPVKLEAADASTWVRRNGSWVCALHTESLAGDPFGRDRRPTA
jgi:hypothetical protein